MPARSRNYRECPQPNRWQAAYDTGSQLFRGTIRTADDSLRYLLDSICAHAARGSGAARCHCCLKMHHRTERRSPDQSIQRGVALRGQTGRPAFGPIPQGHRREVSFAWTSIPGCGTRSGLMPMVKRQVVTTHYHIRPDGILKSQNGGGYRRLSHAETAQTCTRRPSSTPKSYLPRCKVS